MGLFRRREDTYYGSCPDCGHDWREHPGGEFDSDPFECGECQDEANHGWRSDDAGPLCQVSAPPPSQQSERQ